MPEVHQGSGFQAMSISSDEGRHALVQFVAPDGKPAEIGHLDVPLGITKAELSLLLSQSLPAENEEEDNNTQNYSFTLGDDPLKSVPLVTTLSAAVSEGSFSTEQTISLNYFPVASFRVRPATRCACTLSGHTEAVLVCSFSPDGTELASGSGDCTVRVWDLLTGTPKRTLQGHKNWVQSVAWSPDGRRLASGGMDTTVFVWNVSSEKEKGSSVVLRGHNKSVSSLTWQPLHLTEDKPTSCALLASASADATIRIWNVIFGTCLCVCSGHRNMITSVRWSGESDEKGSQYLYSTSRDATIGVWNAMDGSLISQLKGINGHGHWVNCLALNTDSILKTGTHDILDSQQVTANSVSAAMKRYKRAMKRFGAESAVTGSDDYSLCLWSRLYSSSKPLTKMTGHQQPVNSVAFSPDGLLIASASFDKSVRLWDGKCGKFLFTFRGHVAPVYQVAWSADSSMLLSVSADSTMKLWDVPAKRLKVDLPGHADEVYTVDWSSDGARVATGSKDRTVKIWNH